MHDIVTKTGMTSTRGLCETKVLAPSCDGCENLLAKCLVALVLGKIKFLTKVRMLQQKQARNVNLRLKHVCELGSRSLLP